MKRKKSSGIFLVSILVSFLLFSFGPEMVQAKYVEDDDWNELQTNFNTVIRERNEERTNRKKIEATYTNDANQYKKIISVYSNENSWLWKRQKNMKREMVMDKVQKNVFLALLVAILTKIGIEVFKK